MLPGTLRIGRMLGLLGLAAMTSLLAQDVYQPQLDAIKGVLPRFAIPMREVGDRFQNLYFAARGGNWALAAYMSKYMDKATAPAALTKPDEYPQWREFYDKAFAPVNHAIAGQDFKAFDAAYGRAIKSCNSCHESLGYSFIVVTRQKAPSDQSIKYLLRTRAGDVPD